MRAAGSTEVRNAGSVFLGAWTPETMGDYCSGTNHVLPTYGFARAYSGLSLHDFLKRMTVQELTADGLRDLGPTAMTIAALEGLDAHANAVQVRLAHLDGGAGIMNRILELARPDILSLQPYQHAAWEPSLERMHANEMPWRADGDDSGAGLNRYPEPQPIELIEHLARAVWRRARAACSPAAAATKASTCWCARSVAPARTAC